MKTLLLIDLSGIFWAHWHATEQQEVGAAFSLTVGKVHQLAGDYDHVAVCCDAPPYKRKELLPSYKAQRDAPEPNAVEQLRQVKERLATDGFAVWESKGYEADDIIATACALARREEEPLEVTVASADKDLLQLVDDTMRIRALVPLSGLVLDAKGVAEKLGVPPPLVRDFLSLTGDKSDNVPGVPGVGPKNAAKLLEQFGTLEGVLEGASTVPQPKLKENLLASAETVRLAHKLIGLYTDAPLDFDAVFAERKPKPLSEGGEWDGADFIDANREGGEQPTPLAVVEPEVVAPQATPLVVVPEAPPPPVSIEVVPPKAQALAVRPMEWSMQLEPPTAKEAFIVARYFEESRLYPQLGGQAGIFTTILRGRALGLDSATACAMFHNVEGRLTMHAELIIGLVLRSGKAQYFECVETTDEKATWVTKRLGGSGREVSITWDLDRAVRAGMLTRRPDGKYSGVTRSGRPSNWDKYPRTMLRWRAGTELAHACYPEIVSGLVAPNEAEDMAADDEAAA
jgi:5'-3' exonuclease